MKNIYFERAIFLSWYCSKGDCTFCYMSTQKNKIKNPMMAKRTRESLLAEVIICKTMNWKIEFLSGGYESYNFDELVSLIKEIKETYGEKQWLNIGTLTKEELVSLKPYIKGVSGAIECVNPHLRKQICPSKPIKKIEQMFNDATDLGIKKSITIILGLGEKISDFKYLNELINKHNINQITIYRLKPQKDTEYENAPPITKEYFTEWIKLIRNNFPKIKIIVGSWLNQLAEISYLIKAGADGITKFPSIKKFNTKYAHQIKDEVEKVAIFKSNLTKKIPIPKVENIKIQQKINDYLKNL